MKSLYEIVGVEPDADKTAIKKAYKKTAGKLHPDKHNNDAAATEAFKELQKAYTVLMDDKKRADYDNHGFVIEIDLQQAIRESLKKELAAVLRKNHYKRTNYVQHLKKFYNTALMAAKNDQDAFEEQLTNLQHIEEHFFASFDVPGAIAQELTTVETKLNGCKTAILVIQGALEVLTTATYNGDNNEPPSPWGGVATYTFNGA